MESYLPSFDICRVSADHNIPKTCCATRAFYLSTLPVSFSISRPTKDRRREGKTSSPKGKQISQAGGGGGGGGVEGFAFPLPRVLESITRKKEPLLTEQSLVGKQVAGGAERKE